MKFKLTRGVIYLALLVSLIYPYKDFDWGWHYKYGEYFAKTGRVLKTDIFSTTMPGYNLSNHSWSYDIFVYYLYQIASFRGLYFIGPLVFLMIFYLSVKNYNINNWQLAILAVFYSKFTHITFMQGVRVQVIGLLMQVLLITVLQKGFKYSKNYYWLPVLFLFWVNIHASFAAGLAICVIYFVCIIGDNLMQSSPERFQRMKAFGLGLGVSIATTFINPFGLDVYAEALRHLGNRFLNLVLEWKPFNQFCLDCEVKWTMVYFAIILGLVIWKFRWQRVPMVLITAILFAMGLLHLRYMVMAGITGLILVAEIFANIRIFPNKKIVNALLITLSMFIISKKILNLPSYEYGLLSSNLVSMLRINPPQGEGFNNYDLGGVLLGYNLVPKVFVYGHMHLWEKNGFSPFADSLAIDGGLNQVYEKYNFNWVITRSNVPLLKKLSPLDGWKKLYSDSEISYLVREVN